MQLKNLVDIPELLLNCFEFLPFKDIQTLCKVCKEFYRICQYESIWRNLCSEIEYPVTHRTRPPICKSWKEFYKFLRDLSKLTVYKDDVQSARSIVETVSKFCKLSKEKIQRMKKEIEAIGKTDVICMSMIKNLKLKFELDKEGITVDLFSMSNLLNKKVKIRKESLYTVYILNDDHHSFLEVIRQLRIATKTTFVEADKIAWKAHASGKAKCFEGSKEECVKVENVLKKIGLGTEIHEAVIDDVEVVWEDYKKEMLKKHPLIEDEKAKYVVYMLGDQNHGMDEIMRDLAKAVNTKPSDGDNFRRIAKVTLLLQLAHIAPVFVGTFAEAKRVKDYLDNRLYNVMQTKLAGNQSWRDLDSFFEVDSSSEEVYSDDDVMSDA